jgi:hypothetical protein
MLTTEAIVGIMSVFIGIPPLILIVWSLRRRKHYGTIQGMENP